MKKIMHWLLMVARGKKKKAPPRDAVQHFQFAAMFKPFIHMTVYEYYLESEIEAPAI